MGKLSVDTLSNRAIVKMFPGSSRRSFLTRAAMVGTALVVAPKEYVLRPLSAMEAICGCANTNCPCGAPCCNGFTYFCCSINDGLNVCPSGTFIGGWWKADGSTYCSGPRYYMDCNAYCSCQTVNYENFCDPSCDGLTCECALGSCANMAVGCNQFRYGQCHQEIAISGRILCRVITCVPPWEIDGTCTQTLAVDDSTAEHNAPCLEQVPPGVAISSTPTGKGYWLVDSGGNVQGFGDATNYGGGTGYLSGEPVVAMSSTLDGHGYLLLGQSGSLFSYGNAPHLNLPHPLALQDSAVSIVAWPGGNGYYVATELGEIYTLGGAPYYGGASNLHLEAPIVSMAATPQGTGYWLVGADGGVFCFGDANFYGSTGGLDLEAPIIGFASDPAGFGYWLGGQDGGVFTFGYLDFYGSR